MAKKRVSTSDALAGFGSDLASAGLGFDEDLSAAEREEKYAHIDSLPKAAIDQIHADPNQPRNTEVFKVLFEKKGTELRALLDGSGDLAESFAAEYPKAQEVVELARSIRDLGLQTPITLRPRGRGGFYIVYGERRWTAMRLLVQAGYTQFAQTPFLEDDRELTQAEWLALQIAEDWHKSKHSVIDTVASIRRIADEKASGNIEAVPATEIAIALQIHYKAAQRYLRVAKALTASEIAIIRAANEDVDLMPLLKLVEWLTEQAKSVRILTAENRDAAIRRFAEKRPKTSSVKALLSEFAVVTPSKGPGRPAKTRYDAVATRTEGINTYVRVPVTKLTRESVALAERRLTEALERVKALKAEMFG